MIRVIISDEFGQHGLDIKTAISVGYGTDISDQIQIVGYWQPALQEAQNNPDVVALIRSVAGVASYLVDAQAIYPRVQTFFPLGSNLFEQLNIFVKPDPPVIVVNGAGDFTNPLLDKNNTGYGNGLEFWDKDLTVSDTSDESSFSNGIILGKLLKIKDTLNCTWWEARYRARMTADRLEDNRLTTPWDIYNGYGKINVNNAIAYNSAIPIDPYQIPLGQPGNVRIQRVAGNNFGMDWDAVDNAGSYETQLSINKINWTTTDHALALGGVTMVELSKLPYYLRYRAKRVIAIGVEEIVTSDIIKFYHSYINKLFIVN